MSVRAKFKIDAIERTKYWDYGELQNIKGSPVLKTNSPNDENSKFWTLTPSGSFMLGTLSPQAAQYFELGEEYYVDFTKVEK